MVYRYGTWVDHLMMAEACRDSEPQIGGYGARYALFDDV
jgi:hypothetical protein